MSMRNAIVLIATILFLISCASQPTAAPEATASVAVVLPTPLTATQVTLPGKQQGKLSSRLATLAEPTVSSQNSAAQANIVGLPATGPGSLVRNDKGEVLVLVRMNDVGQPTLDALTATGFSTTNVATAFKSVTGYINPHQLRTLAALPSVVNVREELSP